MNCTRVDSVKKFKKKFLDVSKSNGPKFLFGRTGKIITDISANFIVAYTSFIEIFFANVCSCVPRTKNDAITIVKTTAI